MLLLQAQGDIGSLFTLSNILALLGFLSLVGGAVIILKSRAREETHKATADLLARTKETLAQVEHELQLEKGRVKERDAKIEELTEERDTFKTGYNAIGGVTLKELTDFYHAVIGDVRYINSLIADASRKGREIERLHEEYGDAASPRRLGPKADNDGK